MDIFFEIVFECTSFAEHNRSNMQDKNHFVSTSVRVKCLCKNEVSHTAPTSRHKKLIRFLESFVLLPVLAASMPLGGILGIASTDMSTSPQIVLSQQQNIEAQSLLAFNQAMDQKAQTLKNQAKAIDDYFKVRHLPLEGTGAKMAEEADKYGLDYRLMPAIAMIETTGGKNLCEGLEKDNNKNPFGWGSCKIGFSSFNQAIEVIAMNLSGNNPNTARHYDGKTTKQILEKYNPPSIKPGYAAKVMKVMDAIGEEDMAPVPLKVITANT